MSARANSSRPATILDVARLASVSKSTVSNVIRGIDGIAPATQSRVLEAIKTLDYRPNILARQMVRQRTNVLGVIVGDLANPFFAEMVKQLERYASPRGYRLTFCNTQADAKLEYEGIKSLLDHRVAGLLFLAYAGDAASVRLVSDSGVPAAFVTCTAEWGDVICADDVRGAQLATEHLLSLGHRRIAYFSDPTVEDAADIARQTGYRQAMDKARLASAVFHWQDAGGGLLRGADVKKVLAGKSRYTAVFSSNDFGAIELLDCADRLGIKVPEDLSVVGFDDVTLASLARINLTTVAQPKELMAQLAVQTLAARVEGKLPEGNVRQIVDCNLIVRGSTAVRRNVSLHGTTK